MAKKRASGGTDSRLDKIEGQLSTFFNYVKDELKKIESQSLTDHNYENMIEDVTYEGFDHAPQDYMELAKQHAALAQENELQKKYIQDLKEKVIDWKHKYDSSVLQHERSNVLKRQINALRSEIAQYKEHMTELKETLKKKDSVVKEYPERIKERDAMIKELNDQMIILKEEKKIIDEANTKLISEINAMHAHLKKLDGQIELKDHEVNDVRKMLESEKELSEQRIRKRLREFAAAETKKEVLLNVKIKELMTIVEKQRDVICNMNDVDMGLYDKFNETIKQIQEKRQGIDYSVLDKKIEDVKTDVASISDLMDENNGSVNLQSGDDSVSETVDRALVDSVRRSLENGDAPELVKNSLLEQGKDEATVQKVIDEQLRQLNMA
jgi:chromosome segregation ATPase